MRIARVFGLLGFGLLVMSGCSGSTSAEPVGAAATPEDSSPKAKGDAKTGVGRIPTAPKK